MFIGAVKTAEVRAAGTYHAHLTQPRFNFIFKVFASCYSLFVVAV